MHLLLATYDAPKAFQLRRGRLDVGGAAVVAHCNYPYPVRQCQLLEAVKCISPHVSSLATCLSWCSVNLALWYVSPGSAVYRCTIEKRVPAAA
jgi:hypothetical protein